MKVLMFGWEFPPMISGGLGRVCHALTLKLTHLGVPILFVLPKAETNHHSHNFELVGANQIVFSKSLTPILKQLSDRTLQFLKVDAMLNPYMNEESYTITLTSVKKRLEQLKEISVSQPKGWFDFSGGYGTDLFQEVFRYALVGAYLGLHGNFDLIHAHDWMTYPAALEAKRFSGKPLICHVHATEFDRTGDHPNQAIYQIERDGFEACDKIIAVSVRTKDMISQHYGIHPDKIVVIHNAVSHEKQMERDRIKRVFEEKIVLFLGRVTLQKGPDYFVEVARLILNKNKNIRFVMAGTGDMLPRLVERVAQLRMQKYFHFTGFLQGREVEDIFALSDLYIMPSVSEPFGITPLEAMLYHVPVIISKQSGIAEVLKHAPQVDFWDTHKMAHLIIEILTNEKLAQSLIQAGAKELEHFSWQTAAYKVKQTYEALL